MKNNRCCPYPVFFSSFKIVGGALPGRSDYAVSQSAGPSQMDLKAGLMTIQSSGTNSDNLLTVAGGIRIAHREKIKQEACKKAWSVG